MKPRKIPIRRCLGCNEGKPKKELVRVVRNQEGEVRLDVTGKLPGRGAYICPNPACFAKARKAKRFEKEFGQEIPSEVYAQMEAQLAEQVTEDAGV